MSSTILPFARETVQSPENEAAEINQLLDGVLQRYGYNFKNYSRASLIRRLEKARKQAGVDTYTELLQHISAEVEHFDEFLKHMSITVTDVFRDPAFYQSIRTCVVPILKTYPYVKIWHAGCATGEEVYSMAILLEEEGFLGRARIYATDYNKHSLATAEKAVYPAKNLADYEMNYRESGGLSTFSDYYHDGYERIKFKDFLQERITFSYHNLVSDGVFGEMHLICCRNVLIYFNKTLQEQVLAKFTESLRHGGVLALGNKESLNNSVKDLFQPLDKKHRIFQKSSKSMHAKSNHLGGSPCSNS